jgi:hypothetical protein
LRDRAPQLPSQVPGIGEGKDELHGFADQRVHSMAPIGVLQVFAGRAEPGQGFDAVAKGLTRTGCSC